MLWQLSTFVTSVALYIARVHCTPPPHTGVSRFSGSAQPSGACSTQAAGRQQLLVAQHARSLLGMRRCLTCTLLFCPPCCLPLQPLPWRCLLPRSTGCTLTSTHMAHDAAPAAGTLQLLTHQLSHFSKQRAVARECLAFVTPAAVCRADPPCPAAAWLRRYRTTLCGQGEACNRNICFFAHNQQELRSPGSEPAPKGARKKPDADLSGQMARGAGSSSGNNQQMQLAQQLAQLAMGGTYQVPSGPGSSSRGSSAAAAGGGDPQSWIGVSGVGARQSGPGSVALAAAAAASAVVAAGGGSGAVLDPRAAALQGPLPFMAGPVAPGLAGMQAASIPGATPDAAGAYPVFVAWPQQVMSAGSVPQHEQSVLSPRSGSSDAIARLAAAQAQQVHPGLVPGMGAAPGWGMAAYAEGAPAGLPGGLPGGQGAVNQAGQVHAGAGGIPVPMMWVPQAQQEYGQPVAGAGQPSAILYAPDWQGAATAQQQGLPGQQLLQLLSMQAQHPSQQQQAGQSVLSGSNVLPVLPQGAAGMQGAAAEQHGSGTGAQLVRGVRPYRPAPSTRGL